MSNSKLSASNSVTFIVRRDLPSGKKGKAARVRRALRRQTCNVAKQAIVLKYAQELFIHSEMWGAYELLMSEKETQWYLQKSTAKPQTVKYSLDMLQWVFADLLELASYWEEDQALLSRLAGYDKVAMYSYQIISSLEEKAQKPSVGQKVWSFLNKEITVPQEVLAFLPCVGLASFFVAMGVYGPELQQRQLEKDRIEFAAAVQTQSHPLVQQFINQIEEETKHLR